MATENESIRRRVRRLEDEYQQALSGAVSGAARILLRGTADLIDLAEEEIAAVAASRDEWRRRTRRFRRLLIEHGIDPDPLWNDPPGEEPAGAPPEAAEVRPPRVRAKPEALATRRASLARIANDPDQTAQARAAAAAILSELSAAPPAPPPASDKAEETDDPIRFVTRNLFARDRDRVYHVTRTGRRTLCGRDWRLWSGAEPVETFNGGRLCDRCSPIADRFGITIPPYNVDPAYLRVQAVRANRAPGGARTDQAADGRRGGVYTGGGRRRGASGG
jgi:hypothetical protein